MLYIIATDNVIVMLHYISVDNKGGCDVYMKRLGTIRVSYDFYRQSLRATRVTDAYRDAVVDTCEARRNRLAVLASVVG